MDVEMGLIMCNMIQARPGGVVWDPFCGTGSLLINAAHFGAFTMGSDIDIRVIKWGKKDGKTGENVDVWTNFTDYGLEPPVGLLRMDLHKHSWTNMKHVEGMLQGVVGDPPYGVRAGGRKSGGRTTAASSPSQRSTGESLFFYFRIGNY
jgi:tRNA (guanine10-N2)-methyltransferase